MPPSRGRRPRLRGASAILHLTGDDPPRPAGAGDRRACCRRAAIVLADAGAHLAWLGYYLELEEGQSFRKPGSFGPMAGHVNGALGVKMAHPDRTVVVGCGDGCYSLSGFELMTAVQYDIPVIWIIFNDNEFKLIKLYQLAAYGETGLVEFENPDYAAYARACGADGYRVETLEEFEDAFAAALALRPAQPSSTPTSPAGRCRTTARRRKASSPASSRCVEASVPRRMSEPLPDRRASAPTDGEPHGACPHGVRNTSAAVPRPSGWCSSAWRTTSCGSS